MTDEELTVHEAAKRGGAKTKELYGPGYFTVLSRVGGAALFRQRGRAFFRAIGRKGGYAKARKKKEEKT